MRIRIQASALQTFVVESLPNGFVRVDTPGGLVHVWEARSGALSLRSGNGNYEGYTPGVISKVEELLGL